MVYIANYNNRGEVRIFNTLDDLAAGMFDILSEEFIHSLTSGKNYHMALSGGSTPVSIFNKLSVLPLQRIKWDFLHIWWSDERCVPPDNQESNYLNLWNALLKDMKIPADNIHRIRGENDPAAEASSYSSSIRELIPMENGFPAFDAVFLGLGEDGHTASLFPGQIPPEDEKAICYSTCHPQSKQPRITLSKQTINNARLVIFLVTGNNKSKILDRIMQNEKGCEELPAAKISPGSGKLLWLMDKNAGGNLIKKNHSI